MQETDEQGFILQYNDDTNKLIIGDSMGGGKDCGEVLNQGVAGRMVQDYINFVASWMADELVGQIEWPDDESED